MLGRVADGQEQELFGRLGGERIAAIVAGFYRRVPQDPVLGPLYPPHDLAGAEQRLRSFLIYRLGGPPDYLRERGHPRLRMRHAPFPIDQAARDRWLQRMRESIAEHEVPAADAALLEDFLGGIATFLINRA
jgi:hemoglobin